VRQLLSLKIEPEHNMTVTTSISIVTCKRARIKNCFQSLIVEYKENYHAI